MFDSQEKRAMRFDLSIVASWINPGSRVLGLGCGEGELLHHLKKTKNVRETGIEIREDRVTACIEKGLSVLQGDIDREIEDYPDGGFDYVILSQTLQQVYNPEKIIREILRVGKRAIVSFPNFGHWRVRTHLFLTGKAPVTRELPFQWYDTPNIRVLSLEDFRTFSRKIGFNIHKEAAILHGNRSHEGKVIQKMPNLLATYGIYEIGR